MTPFVCPLFRKTKLCLTFLFGGPCDIRIQIVEASLALVVAVAVAVDLVVAVNVAVAGAGRGRNCHVHWASKPIERWHLSCGDYLGHAATAVQKFR